VIALAERFGLGVYTAFRRQDHFPNTHPQYLGHLALGTPPTLLAPLAAADVVLALGTRLGDTTTQGFTLPAAGARVIHVDVEPAALKAPVHLAWSVRADVGPVAEGLLAVDPGPGTTSLDWSAEHARYLEASTVVPSGRSGAGAVDPADVVGALARHLPADSIVANDAGNFSVYGHRYWRFDHPRTQLGPVSGAMGYGVPAAIGAGLAERGRPVVALAGDGGFLMTGQELETAVRYDVPLLAVVFQNGLYGTIAMHQARRFGRTPGAEIGDVDLAGYARALGAGATTVGDPGDLDDAVAAAVAGADRPHVLVVRTPPDVLVPGVTLSGILGRGDG
jgi:acetolactate synthase-1/2/3 large subunit